MSAARKVLPHASDEQLRLYALGALEPAERHRVEAHLAACPACSAVLRSWQTSLVLAVEALPVPETLPPLLAAPPTVLAAPSGWPRSAWAAAVILLTVTALGWNLRQAAVQRAVQQERQLVSGWLARPGVRLVTLNDLHKRPSGRVLLSAEGQALFVLPDAPPGLEYRAWVARDWHLGQPMRLARQSRDGTFAVSLGQNDYLCLSLETPDAPHTGPTFSRILGKAFF